MKTEIDVNAWDVALRKSGAYQDDDDPNVFTTAELADALVVHTKTAIQRLHLAKREGLIEHTKKWVESLSGKRVHVDAYRLKLKPAKKGKR